MISVGYYGPGEGMFVAEEVRSAGLVEDLLAA